MDKLAELIARHEIEEVILRYARGVDRRDWDSVRDCYHHDSTDSHGDYSGGPEGFIAWVSDRHAEIPFSMHFIGNCLIDFIDDTTAVVETYFIAMQRREATVENGLVTATDHEVFGRYCDRIENRGDGWRLAVRKVVYDNTGCQPSTNHLRAPIGIAGRRDSSDPVYDLAPRTVVRSA